MYLQTWLDSLQSNLNKDLIHFAPELVLCLGIVLMLLVRLFTRLSHAHMGTVALVFTVIAIGLNWEMWDKPAEQQERADLFMFSGLLAFDNFTLFLRLFLLAFTILVIWLTILTGIPDREDSAD